MRVSERASMSEEKRTPKKGLLVKMSQSLHTDLKILATKRNTDMTTIVVQLIKEYVEVSNDETDDSKAP